MNTNKKITVVAMFMVSPLLSSAQHFQRLYDVDTGQDWGMNIVLKESSYFIAGWSYNGYIGGSTLFSATIDTGSNNIVSRATIAPDSFAGAYSAGDPGEIKILPGGSGYVIPINLLWPDPATSNVYCASGFERIDSLGNRMFIKTFTDTSIYLDFASGISIVPGNTGYLIAGSHQHTDLSDQFNFPAYLIHTDTLGDTIWTHTYRKFSDQYCIAFNAIPINGGRIVLYAYSSYLVNTFNDFYWHYTPWFLLLDSSGHVLKDTLYSHGYMTNAAGAAGGLYPEVNGGYVWVASYDSLYDTMDVEDPVNFPGFIAHLDTNFRITWSSEFSPCASGLAKNGCVVRQLRDSGYLVVGQGQSNLYNGVYGFAAKVSQDGNMVWNNLYYSDSLGTNYLRDGVEMPDGNIVLSGMAKNDTLPAINQKYDLWLVGIDSNGCESPFCIPTSVKGPPGLPQREGVLLYPNPTHGSLAVSCEQGGALEVYNIQGQKVATYKLKTGTNDLRLPANLNDGVYVCRFISSESDNAPVTIRLIYEH